jgi:hypothetical protein
LKLAATKRRRTIDAAAGSFIALDQENLLAVTVDPDQGAAAASAPA